MAISFRPKRIKRSLAENINMILKKGEVLYEIPEAGTGIGSGRIKMGDGVTPYKDLPYFDHASNTIYSKPVKSDVSDFKYNIDFKNINFQDGLYYFETHSPFAVGGCSSLREGNLHGRNYDWEYDNSITFEVFTESSEYYKMRGFVGKAFGLDKDFMESGKDSEMFKYLPFLIIDGINEKNLSCNLNVVHVSKNPKETRPGKQRVCNLMLASWILSRCATVKEALEELKNISIFPNKDLAFRYGYEIHMMLNDKDNCYVAEIEDGILYFTDLDTGICTKIIDGKEVESYTIENLAGKKCMTNFRIKNITVKEDGTVDKDAVAEVEEFASGIERWEVLTKSAETDMIKRMKLAAQHNAFDIETDPFWISEFAGVYPSGKIIKCNSDINDPEVQELINTAISNYKKVVIEDKNRNAELKPWQTVYTQCFNLDNKSITYCIQEVEDSYETEVYQDFDEISRLNRIIEELNNK